MNSYCILCINSGKEIILNEYSLFDAYITFKDLCKFFGVIAPIGEGPAISRTEPYYFDIDSARYVLCDEEDYSGVEEELASTGDEYLNLVKEINKLSDQYSKKIDMLVALDLNRADLKEEAKAAFKEIARLNKSIQKKRES